MSQVAEKEEEMCRYAAWSLGLWFAAISVASAESLPQWTPADLVPRSDLVLLASQTAPNKLTVAMAIKGACPERELTIPALGEFREEFSRFGEKAKPDLSGQVVVFLSLRDGNSIVANGTYRITTAGQVLGYAQEMNPGPYELQPAAAYPSLDSLIDKIEIAKTASRKRQASLMEQVADAKDDAAFREALHALDEVTRLGDTNVFDFIASEMSRGGRRGRYCLNFLQNIPDPTIFPLLKAQYERTKKVTVLTVMGQQGSPAALPFLEQAVLSREGDEASSFASFAIMTLYQSLKVRGNKADCEKVENTIFRLFDERPFFQEYAMSNPHVLGVIPNTGAISRLEEIHKRVKGDRSNREYQVEHALRECRRRIAENAKPRK